MENSCRAFSPRSQQLLYLTDTLVEVTLDLAAGEPHNLPSGAPQPFVAEKIGAQVTVEGRAVTLYIESALATRGNGTIQAGNPRAAPAVEIATE
ncbi:MAG: hypothetical protein QHH75_10890 [Bacillota bacterium]|nr:hypothetical protein [Bacillota bacterium]